MSHSFFLCSQVSFIIRIRTVSTGTFSTISNPYASKPTRFTGLFVKVSFCVLPVHEGFAPAYSIITFVGKVSQTNIRVNGIHTVFLQLICFHLFHQTDATSFLIEINHHAFPSFFDHFHRFMQLLATVTTL